MIRGYLVKPTEKGLKDAQSILDKSVKKNIWHKNKVARLKSEMTKKLTSKEIAKTPVKKTAPKKTTKRTAKEKMSK